MHYRLNHHALGADECTLHILYLDRHGATHKMTVGMSQSQEVVLAHADKIRLHFTELLKAFECTVLSMQLELLKPLVHTEHTGSGGGGQSKARIIPFPHMGTTGLGIAALLVDEGVIDLAGWLLS